MPLPCPPRRSRPPSRRTALLGGLGGLTAAGLALTGCDTDDLRPPDAEAPLTPSASSAGAPTADEALVKEAAAAVFSAWTTVLSARGIATLRRPLASLDRAHRRHLTSLDNSQAGRSSPDVSLPADATAGLNAVRTAEQTLRQQLVDFAVRAESGTLAGLLASMSASVAQHLTSLGPAT